MGSKRKEALSFREYDRYATNEIGRLFDALNSDGVLKKLADDAFALRDKWHTDEH